MWPDHSFTNFIMEVDVNGTEDNDGMGITFGWESADNYMRAVLMNDEWPNPAADGVGGPFMKIKARNSRQCLASMDQSNNCFDTLAYLTNDDHGQLTAKSYNPPNWGPSNFNHPSRQMSYSNGPGATGLPEPFAQTYPFQRGIKYHGDNGADIFTLTLIVEDGEVTFQFYHRGQAVGTRASLPSTYNGGKVGFFTCAAFRQHHPFAPPALPFHVVPILVDSRHFGSPSERRAYVRAGVCSSRAQVRTPGLLLQRPRHQPRCGPAQWVLRWPWLMRQLDWPVQHATISAAAPAAAPAALQPHSLRRRQWRLLG